MHYIKNKRNQIDSCNICGQVKELTWDHVPPKSSGNNTEINVNTLYKGLPTENNYQKKFQNGIKFRSLCRECNSILLSKYDTAYKEFIEDIKRLMETAITLPQTVQISIEINKVLRAICGHVLAAKNHYDSVNKVDIELRKYVLDEQYKIDSNFKLYYWIYPYKTVCIVRDVFVKGYSDKVNFPQKPLSSLASFPIAFVLEPETDDSCGLMDLFKFATEDINEIVKIPLDFRSSYYPGTENVRDFLWPCNVGDEWDDVSFIVGGDEMMFDSRVGVVNGTIKNKKR